ncbi:CRISPR-associated helicase/endonuclease Cas3 [Chroogloeocystis siderophila]|uniref:CRISPR-associated helicase/endonuclease Cas3 n=1 Tax=Chroogloeocystis siderophila 5.2 s.c.1 TaxID=247279 RepID=A0A1U7HMC1_9CHRO|nr:CRISPR-associated helicase/endonuclease Cas3 [Chroogloeocystis siderophila]OKH24701.1 CRISPR-associated helicase/endonuclease Cas3 [Chroogloeocystis siderophila 5.2 s.c.1]
MQPKLVPDILLAKSFKAGAWRGSYGLVGHTADVVNAVSTLVDTLGDRLIEQFGLECSLSELRATARLSAYIHDWGKANEHFQGVVRAKMPNASPKRYLPDSPQMIRHEVASVLLAWEFREWLEQGEGDFLTALAAAGGHHLKLGGRGGKCTDEFGEIRRSGDDRLHLYVLDVIDGKIQYNPHFRQLLKYGITALELPATIKLARKPSTTWSVSQIKEKQFEIQDFLTDKWQADPAWVAVIKALLIAGDAAGSAIPNTRLSIHKWIAEQIQCTLDGNKLQRVIDARLDGKELRPFQIQLAQSSARVTLARAGCGTGKTLGAYKWGQSKAIGRKMIFCYPTTGTSTEGFLDYVHHQVDSVLLHSRADVDLEMAATGEEEEVGETHNEAILKLESFKAWGKEAIVCTVDTVLGLLQCNRKSIYCFPAIAQAAFVFDEVHCYDDRLFGALLRFLEVVKAPILLMSASFLPWQKEAIAAAVSEPIEIISGPVELEQQPRYRFHYVEKTLDWERVERELQTGGKVLWVCNQVNTAISVYQEAKAKGFNTLLYHSRYCYQDRLRHHRDVVDAFKPEQKKPVLAIATQVAEMSLDLSATLLISQIADPAGLIQRLGRLNRRYCGRALDAIFYDDEKIDYPYSQKELDDGLRLIQSFTGEVCQGDLARWLESSEQKGKSDPQSVLLDGHWRTYSTSLREAGFNVTALLEQDLNKVKSLPAKEIPRYTVPIPAKNTHKWERYKFYPVAPKKQWSYSAELGAYELKEEKLR